MDLSVKLVEQKEPYVDPGRYKSFVGKLSYFIATYLDITFVVSVVSQLLNSPCPDHWNALVWILKNTRNAPRKGLNYEDKRNIQIVGFTGVVD